MGRGEKRRSNQNLITMYNEKVKNSGVCYCKTMLLLFVMCLGMHLSVKANNVRLNGIVKVTDVTSGGLATLELDLEWDNSWRDNFNWDAVWIFLKYKPASGAWAPVYLQATGNEASPGYQVMNGKNSDGHVVGVYVFLDGNDTKQHASTKVTLKWQCGYTKASFDENQVFLLAQGIEMVYIPFGAYYLGDGTSANTLCASDGKPLAVGGEEAIPLYQRASNGTVNTAVSNLNANYPKGNHGFYVMKYETSQEQYVTFLNTLTKAQQEELLGASFLSALSPGRYIFGDTVRPSYRNGIVLSAKPQGQPYVFDNDLNGNGVYGEDGDGQCVACNYMSLHDVSAYASWAGLRPMSELEYERACRVPFPQTPKAGEFVWNDNAGVSQVTGLNAWGKETEVANNTSCNVNSGSGLTRNNQGPVRCGLFARSTSTQLTAGATFWGVMEMGGNVQEIVGNVTNTSLGRTYNGSGYYSYAYWGSAPGQFGVRGGSFAGADSLLRTSDRSKIYSYFSSWGSRDSTVGFRLVRTLDDGEVAVNPGTISLRAPLCPGVESTVLETGAASVTGVTGDFPITYIWSYSTNNGSTWAVIPGEAGNTLKYSAFVSGRTYLFRRTAVCALGEALTQTTGITASALTKITREPADTVKTECRLSISVTATGTSLTYQWEKDGGALSGATFATYVENLSETSDTVKYVCKVTGACGTVSSKEIVAISGVAHKYEDGVLRDSRDGKTYKIRKMPDGHWWMVEDLKFGNCSSSTFRSYYQGSTSGKIASGYYGVCIASTQSGAGYLYNWQGAMNAAGAYSGSNSNPSGNTNGHTVRQWQGICPPGWHLPSGGSDGEFQALYDALCNTVSRIYPGTGKFEGVLGGHGDGSSVKLAGTWGYHWSSTYYDTTSAYRIYFGSSGVYLQTTSLKYGGFAVRCVKDY